MSVFTFLFLVVVVIAVCMLGSRVIVTVKGSSAKADQGYGADDTRLMQDLHRIATRLEARVETLETILIDRVNCPEEEHTRHD